MSTFEYREELIGLVDAACEDRLTGDQFERLATLLRDHPDAQLTYMAYVQMDGCLRWEHGAELTRRRHLLDAKPRTPRQRTAVRVQGSGLRVQRLAWSVAAAIALLVGAWFVLFRPELRTVNPESSPATRSVAMLTHTEGAIFADAAAPMNLGRELSAGPIKLLAGKAQVMFNSTAVVDLIGPCEFRMIDDNLGILSGGRLKAYVPVAARGFTIELSDGTRLVDLGTQFFVDAESASRAVVGVLEGQVRVDVGEDHQMLTAGRVVTLDHQRISTRSEPLDGLIAYWPLDVDGEGRWGTMLSGQLRGGASFEDSEGLGGAVRLTAGGHLEVDGEGPGLGDSDLAIALWFKRSPDPRTNLRLLSYGGGHDNDPGFAILGSDRSVNVLMRGDSMRVGAGASTSGPDHWHHLAVNMDRDGAMTLYLDGRRAGSANLQPFAGRVLTPNRPLWIGGQPGVDLGWEGLIDEARIYRRTLNEDEIRTLAQPPGQRHAVEPKYTETHTASPHKESLR